MYIHIYKQSLYIYIYIYIYILPPLAPSDGGAPATRPFV